MSGGSFNYLCYVDADELATRISDLRDMAGALTSEGAKSAAAETESLIAYIEHSQRQIEARAVRLNGVWKALEWWRSADWSEEAFREAVAEYDSE